MKRETLREEINMYERDLLSVNLKSGFKRNIKNKENELNTMKE
jgi:hypothetical protein